MKSTIHSRVLGGIAAAAVSMLILSGCAVGGGDGSTTLSDKPVTISLNWWGAAARDKLTRTAIDLFEKKHPNITVKGQSTEWAGYWDKLATTVAGGQAPDVMQFDQLYLASYAQRGALADLDKYSKILDTSDLPASIRGQGQLKDTMYGVPIGLVTTGIIVNRTMLDKYGISLPDTDSWTWDDLAGIAQAVTKASGGSVHGINPFGGDTPSLTLWARQYGNELYDKSGNVVLKESVLESYWQYMLDQIKSGAAPGASQLAEGASATIDQSDIATGKTAMTFQPSAVLTAFQAAAPDKKLDLLPLPSRKGAHKGYQYLKPSMYWTISSKSKHPAEAAELIDFLTTDPEVGKLFGTERGTPANPAFQKAIAPKLSPTDVIVSDVISKATAIAGDAPAITPVGAGDSDTILGRYSQDVQFGKKTPKEAAKEFIADLTKAVKDAK
ncbi:sugar ABC transporter substrate-binding protein [Glaciihabitans sp. UYNi722]|uniref:ABC transporter substrate-binding protein n=1 Tax=Glaciihabitans sp. UYNi722 TaxID=3156344 RepID=UPI003394756D